MWYTAPTMLQAGGMEEVELLPCREPVASSFLFILLY
jgi:hypothetical protein